MASCAPMYAFRALREPTGLGQRDFAELLGARLETLRTWDSGRRPVPASVLRRAQAAAADRQRQHELLPLVQLARELGVPMRTLQAAARTDRLEAQFSVRSAFGRPIRTGSRAAGQRFLAKRYCCFSGQEVCPLPLPVVPEEYDEWLRDLRRRLRVTQGEWVGAAGKAVIYQWESRKRRPSPVFWQRIVALTPASRSSSRKRTRMG